MNRWSLHGFGNGIWKQDQMDASPPISLKTWWTPLWDMAFILQLHWCMWTVTVYRGRSCLYKEYLRSKQCWKKYNTCTSFVNKKTKNGYVHDVQPKRTQFINLSSPRIKEMSLFEIMANVHDIQPKHTQFINLSSPRIKEISLFEIMSTSIDFLKLQSLPEPVNIRTTFLALQENCIESWLKKHSFD